MEFESCFIELILQHEKNIIVGSVYRVPGTNEKTFITRYKNLLKRISATKKVNIIIGIDQNLDYIKLNQHKNTSDFLNTNISLELLPTITKPTRITKNSATLIDNVYISTE